MSARSSRPLPSKSVIKAMGTERRTLTAALPAVPVTRVELSAYSLPSMQLTLFQTWLSFRTAGNGASSAVKLGETPPSVAIMSLL